MDATFLYKAVKNSGSGATASFEVDMGTAYYRREFFYCTDGNGHPEYGGIHIKGSKANGNSQTIVSYFSDNKNLKAIYNGETTVNLSSIPTWSDIIILSHWYCA